MKDLNALATEVHAANRQWWTNLDTGEYPIERNVGELLMLVVSEYAEAMEGDRKSLPDDKLPHRPMREVELADALIRLLDIGGAIRAGNLPGRDFSLNEGHRTIFRWSGNFAADLFLLLGHLVDGPNRFVHTPLDVRVLYSIHGIVELAAFYSFDLWGAYEEKMIYNSLRRDHSREGRLAEGGKRY